MPACLAHASSHRWSGALATTWALILATIGAWLLTTPEGRLRQELAVLQFWWLDATVAVVVGASVPMIAQLGRCVTRVDKIRILLLAVIASALVLLLPPRTSRIYYDEQIYQGIARNLADLKRAQMCNDGTVEYGRLQCRAAEYNKQPYAYPHLLSLAYRAFGARPTTAFAVNAAVMAASVVVVYLIALILFGNRMAAFHAGLLLALTPEQLMWSATAAAEPSAALACSAALLAAVQFVRDRTRASLVAAVVLAAYAVQFRPESLLLLLPLAVLCWQHARAELSRPRLWWALLIGLLLTAVHLGHLYAVRNDAWGTTGARLSLEYVAGNLRVNGGFFLGDDRFPILITLLAGVGLSARRARGWRLPLFVYFAAFFGIDLLFYAGSYDYGADVRYSLMTYPPLVLLAGLGVATIVEWLERLAPAFPARHAAAAAVVFQFLWYTPLIRAVGEEGWAARADVAFAKAVAPKLGGDAYVLTQNPSMFHVWGVNAGQMSMVAANPSYLDYLSTRFKGGVYLHWNFWCNVPDLLQQAICAEAFALRRSEMVYERTVRDQRFAFYRYQPSERREQARTIAPPPRPIGTADNFYFALTIGTADLDIPQATMR